MKLWLIYQDINGGYDTYDRAVVAAEDEDTARRIHPSGSYSYVEGRGWCRPDGSLYRYAESDWTIPVHVGATLVGDAAPGTVAGVVCASFNAG